MPLYDYLTSKLDFKRKSNHRQSFLYKGRLTVRTIRKFRIGSSLRIESRIGSSIRNRILKLCRSLERTASLCPSSIQSQLHKTGSTFMRTTAAACEISHDKIGAPRSSRQQHRGIYRGARLRLRRVVRLGAVGNSVLQRADTVAAERCRVVSLGRRRCWPWRAGTFIGTDCAVVAAAAWLGWRGGDIVGRRYACLLYTSPSPRDRTRSRMPSSA